VAVQHSQAAVRTSFIEPASSGVVDFEFSFAFQPIVDVDARKVISFEALVRGPCGEPSSQVFARVPPQAMHSFDQACRVKAIRLAARLHLDASLNLNFLPNSIRQTSEYLYATLKASEEVGIPAQRLVFEVTETEYLQHAGNVERVFDTYASYGFGTAIDDFQLGFAALGRLAEHQPTYIKLDRHLIADIHKNRMRQVIVGGIRGLCSRLSVTLVAEGVEQSEEYRWLREAGIHIFQGYYFARPAFEALTRVSADLF
jgi:EAL domain-containing protein (putative c-di-GMP-specific phosphodiesterase class I)